LLRPKILFGGKKRGNAGRSGKWSGRMECGMRRGGKRWKNVEKSGNLGIGKRKYWEDGRTFPFPPPRLSILPSWPQPYFIGVLCVPKGATKLAKLPLKLAGE